MKRSTFFTSFFSKKASGSNPFTSQAKRVECCDASKSVIGPAPGRPARRHCQVSSVPIASGDTSPTPVTTTLRFAVTAWSSPARRLLLARVLFDVVDGFLDAGDLLGVLVRDLDPELLFQPHHQLHGVEAVGAEVVDERGLRRDGLLLDSQLVHDDLLDSVGNRLHARVPPERSPAAASRLGRNRFYMWKPPSTARTWPVT